MSPGSEKAPRRKPQPLTQAAGGGGGAGGQPKKHLFLNKASTGKGECERVFCGGNTVSVIFFSELHVGPTATMSQIPSPPTAYGLGLL